MEYEERVVCMDLMSGDQEILSLGAAMHDLSGSGLYSEQIARLRQGEAILMPSGRSYRALSTIDEFGMEGLPASAAN